MQRSFEMPKHTPGPWTNGYGTGITGPTTPNIQGATVAEYLEYRKVAEDADYPPRRSRIVSCDGRTVAIVPDVDGDALANARLIAAAPDLLKACQESVLRIPECFGAGRMLREAIAKALNHSPAE